MTGIIVFDKTLEFFVKDKIVSVSMNGNELTISLVSGATHHSTYSSEDDCREVYESILNSFRE